MAQIPTQFFKNSTFSDELQRHLRTHTGKI